MTHKRIAVLSCIVWGILSGFCGGFAATMRYVEPTEPLTYDPLYVEDRIALHLSSLLFNTLVGTNVNFRLTPELLDSLDLTSPKPGIYRCKLRSGVQWVGYDGDEIVPIKPFTAADVVHTFQRIQNSPKPTAYDYVKVLFQNVRQIANDEVEFEMRPAKSHLDQDFVLRSLKFAVTPDLSGVDTKKLERFKGEPVVGTGTFGLAEEGIFAYRLNKNKVFFRSKHNTKSAGDRLEISKIEMSVNVDPVAVYQSLSLPKKADLKLHLATEIPLEHYGEINANPNIGMKIHGTNSFTFIAYNCGGVFKDKRLRLAFTHAFDRKEIFVNVYGEIYTDYDHSPIGNIKEIIHCPLPTHQTPTDIPIVQYNPEKAANLKAELMGDEKIGERVKEQIQKGFDLFAYTESAMEDRICQMFATQIGNNLGIQVRVVPLPKRQWIDKMKNNDFEIAFGPVSFNQDVNVIKTLFGLNSPQNYVRYRNEEIETRLDEYDRVNHPELRRTIKNEMAEIIAQDVPYTFLYRIPKYAAYRSDVLGGVDIHPYYFFSFINQWYMKGQ